MKTPDHAILTPTQQQALDELRRRLLGSFDIEAMNIFGSVMRGEADEESDIDLLIITARPLQRPLRHQITDIVFEINLRYGTNFSTLVVDRASWETGMLSVLPLHDEIVREGVAVYERG
jgi:predicted nucleotidyltransferase